MINAINEVVKTRKDVLCVIGGSGPLRDKLQKQIDNLNLQSHVLLIGFIPDELLSFWMYACDVFVLPSLSEENPTVMFECLGCGKPLIGTKVGGVPEIITSDDYGLVVEPKSSNDLANMINIALNKKWNTQHIKRYSEQFTWENIAKNIIFIYEKVLSIS